LIVGCPAAQDGAPVQATREIEIPDTGDAKPEDVKGDPDPIPEPESDPTEPESDSGGDPGGALAHMPDPDPLVPDARWEPKTKKKPKGAVCRPDYDLFDGKCFPAEKAKKLQEKRDEKHLKELQDAKTPVQQEQVQQKVLDDQVQQLDQYEDDLDEILDDLAKKKKKGEGPFNKKGGGLDDPFDG